MLKLVLGTVGGLLATVLFLATVAGGALLQLTSTTHTGRSSTASQQALADIPADYLTLYQQAAPTCPGLDWSILSSIGKVETNHGRLNAPGVHSGENSAGAAGPMQFLAATFAAYTDRIPPGGESPPSRYNPHDAIHAAAAYLCDSGARNGHDLYAAIYAYNHADWYVRKVLEQAEAYRAARPALPQAGAWVLPAQGRCSSGFGPRNGDFHPGQDIAAPIGTPIVAASSGTVVDAGPASGYGLWIRIQHPDGVVTTYGHNNRNLVQSGQQVHTGQVVGEVGDRGQSTGPHVHFQVDTSGQPVDPVAFYQHQSGPPLCG